MNGAVFVIDGHDIDLHPDVQSAEQSVEGYDIQALDFMGVDGTVYAASTKGQEWDAVTLRPTTSNRLEDLTRLLLSEADSRSLTLPPETPREPEAIWAAVLAAQQHARTSTRRRRWWRRHIQ